ncbi:MAG: GPH family glycoside/pentoside/hexuronide:cation symporter [Flavobacterium sp.]
MFFSGLFFGAATGLATALSIYFGTFFWLLKSSEIGLIPLLGLIAVSVSFFIAPKFSARLGKKKAAMRVFMFAIVFLPLAYIAQLLVFSQPENQRVICIF